MLTTSKGFRFWDGRSALLVPSPRISLYGINGSRDLVLTRPSELSTMIVFEDDIANSEFSKDLLLNSCRSGTLDRGGFHGRFVSAPVTKWDALR